MVYLCFQHILLFGPDADKDTNRIGILDPKCKVKSVIEQAFGNAANLCDDYYGLSPEINIKGETDVTSPSRAWLRLNAFLVLASLS